MKKKSSIIISLPNPCHENWDEMTPVEKGRFCSACQKTVIDFTIMSDEEILNVFKQGNVCGNFFQSQLNRVLISASPQPKRTSIIKKVAASFFLLQTIINSASAQTVRKPRAAVHSVQDINKTNAKILKGRVLDYTTRHPLANIEVSISYTSLSTVSDKNGWFKILVPDSLHNQELTLTTKYSRYTNSPDSATIIPNVDVIYSDINEHTPIVLYRYPVQVLSQTNVEAQANPIINPVIDRIGGVPDIMVKELPRHRSFWNKIKGTFTGKRKHD